MGVTGRAMAFEGRGEPAHRGEGPPSRVVIEGVRPEIDAGLFPIKRTVGEEVVVSADIFAEGHDLLAAVVKSPRRGHGANGPRAPMAPGVNDRWTGGFRVDSLGRHEYTIEAWVDRFRVLASATSPRRPRPARTSPASCWKGPSSCSRPPAGPGARRPTGSASAPSVLKGQEDQAARIQAALDPQLAAAMAHYPDRRGGLTYERTLGVDRRARAGPLRRLVRDVPPLRCRASPGGTGRFKDTRGAAPVRRLDGLRRPVPAPDPPDRPELPQGPEQHPGSPAPTTPAAPGPSARSEGGHKAIHPELGTLEDFDRLVAAARELGIEIALDIAFQCSPDHPYVREHPQWFRHRPDGIDQVRREPAQEVPGHLSDRLRVRATGGPSGTSSATSSCSGSTTASRSSASTTRTPSRSGSGTG